MRSLETLSAYTGMYRSPCSKVRSRSKNAADAVGDMLILSLDGSGASCSKLDLAKAG